MSTNRIAMVLGLASSMLAACGGAQPATTSPERAAAPTGPVTEAAPPSSGGAAASPGSSELERAEASIKSGEFASARASLERALQKSPKNAKVLYYLGVCLEHLEDKAGAEKYYKEALAANPDLVEAALNLGALWLDASRWDDAIAVTEKALHRRSDDPGLHANMAVALSGKGDKQRALASYERAVKLAGDNAELRFGYASLLLESGDKTKASAELKAALGGAAGNRALLASLGRALGQAGAFADCVAALDKAIALGDDPELRVRRGLCRHSMKDEVGAKADFEAAASQNPKFAPARYYLGESLLAAGNGAQAAKEFDAAAAAAPAGELAEKARHQAEAARKRKK